MAKKHYLEEKYGLRTNLPNIKKLFVPEPGYVYVDVDLEQADAQVVAWESDCQRLKDIFKDPTKDFHSENAFGFYEGIKGETVGKYEVNLGNGVVMIKAEDEWRKPLKAGAHATNYRVKAPTLAKTLECTVADAEDFINTWFILNPEIKKWHERTESEVMGRGYIENKFGFRRTFLGRVTQDTLAEAQGWVPQSTVGNVINEGWTRIEREINGFYGFGNREPQIGERILKLAEQKVISNIRKTDYIKVAFQVHDSLVMKVREKELKMLLPEIRECMLVTIPYDDPLVIGLGNPEVSNLSYGQVKPYSWITGEPIV